MKEIVIAAFVIAPVIPVPAVIHREENGMCKMLIGKSVLVIIGTTDFSVACEISFNEAIDTHCTE